MMALKDRPILSKLIRNFGWQSFDKIFRMGVGVVVNVWVIRYLGPEDFGVFSYAAAFAGIFFSVAGMGLDGIVMREISKDIRQKDVVLGTAFRMKLGGGAVSLLVILAAIVVLRPHDLRLILMTGIFGVGLIFNAADVIDFWFQSQVKAKYSVIARSSAFALSSLLKVALIVAGASVVPFVLAAVGETILTAAALIGAYRLTGNHLRRWRSDWPLAKTLLAESWPLILSGFAVFIYMRIDQVMLGGMLDDKAVGIYAAATKFSEIWYFIPTSIMMSVFPVMVTYFQTNRPMFFRKYQTVFSSLAGFSIALALLMTIFSSRLVNLVYGRAFSESGPILAVHIWAGVFVFLGRAGSIWTMINGYQKFSLLAALAGLVVKVVLNRLAIPVYGPMAAAVSMIICQAIAAYLMYAAWSRTRPVFWMMTRALLMPWKNIDLDLFGRRQG